MNINRNLLTIFLCILILSLCTSISHAKDKRVLPDAEIAFNFIEVEIPTVIKFISEITGYNFIFDERIKGKITIIAPTKLSIEESFTLFTSILGLKGFTIIPTSPETYKIIPSSLAKQQGQIPDGDTMPVNEGYITKLIPTEHIKVANALQFLRPVVSRDGHISAFGPRNLLLIVDSAVNVDKIMSILKLIDKPSTIEEPAKINVYFLEHADAIDLAEVLKGIIKDMQSSYKIKRRGKKDNGKSAEVPILSVTPDKATNSLIIVAPPEDYRNISSVVKTLDRKRKQVYVEAMIVEASIDKLKELGTKWRGALKHKGAPIAIGGFGEVSASTVQSIITGLTGFSVGGMGSYMDIPVTSITSSGTISSQTLTAPGFAALFSFNVFQDSINVLSTPQILTSDNEEAEIIVGENVPFISSRESSVTTANTILSSIERKDVGILLRITPQITEGDYVKLSIFQEISSIKESTESILTSVGPTTTKRSTKTTVVVKDGQTVVIGGLMQETDEEGTAKMPILGDIPILGWLFKTKTVTKNKKNLLVFLSPHIIKDSPQLAQITKDKHEEFVTKEKFYSSGELLVKFNDGVSKERILEIINQKEASVIKLFNSINVYHIKLHLKHDVEKAVKEFSSMDEVLYAEPNYKMKIQSDKRLQRNNINNIQIP